MQGVRHQAKEGLEAVFAPRSVAVVGASPRPGSVGHALLANVVAGGFAGPVHPVHPTAPDILGLRACPGVAAIPGQVDLAVVAVAALEETLHRAAQLALDVRARVAA